MTFTSNAIIAHSQNVTEANLRKRVLKESLNSSVDKVKEIKSGDFVNFIVHEPGNVSTIIIHLYKILQNTILICLYITILIIFNYLVLVIFSILFLAIFLVSKFFSSKSYNFGTIIKLKTNDLFRQVLEIFRSIKLIKLSNLESSTSSSLHNEIDLVKKYNFRFMLSKIFVETISPLLVVILLISMIPIIEKSQNFSFVEIGLYFGISLRIYNLYTQYSVEKISLSRKFVHLENLENFFKNISKSFDLKGGKTKFTFRKIIEFKKVSFFYGKNEILKDCDLKLYKNKITAIVGNSGSGKSTILDILTYFFKPTSGQILIDGKNFYDIKKESIRANIGMVSQEINILNDSIRKNLTFTCKRKVSDKEISEVAKIAGIDEFINSRPKKLDSNIGDAGSLVSGGQLQRIAFARCLLEKKKIIILDEPTSSLDKKTAMIVNNYLKSIKNKLTVLIVAHSSDIIKLADHIYLLDNKKTTYLGQFKTLRNFKYKGLK